MSPGGGQPAPPSRTGGGMPTMAGGMKKGGKVKKMAKGGSVSSASKRGDGCATKGKTKGRFVIIFYLVELVALRVGLGTGLISGKT